MKFVDDDDNDDVFFYNRQKDRYDCFNSLNLSGLAGSLNSSEGN